MVTTSAAQPSASPPSLQELLEDAKHVASHGVRVGALKDDHPLFEALAEAEAEAQSPQGLAWDSRKIATLHKALGNAVQAIRPVTLHHLKGGWRIDGRTKGGPRAKVLKFLVLCVTVVMMFICASLTMWHQRGVVLLERVAENKPEQQLAALEEFVFLVGSLDDGEGTEKIMDPSSAVRTALRHKYAALLAVESAIDEDRSALEDLQRGNILKRVWTATGSLGRQAGTVVAAATGLATGRGAAVAGDVSDKAPVLVQPAIATEPLAPEDLESTMMSGGDACGEWPDWQDEELREAKLTDIQLFERAVEHDRTYTGWIRCKTQLKLAYALLTAPVKDDLLDLRVLREVRLDLDSVGTWWLPTFYGMLGALIYHLRAYLSSTRPDPSFLPVVMRVCLGGFAGVSVAWFWQPDNGAFVGLPVEMSTLTLAFLMGFAIDVFLSFLDRLVTLMHRWVGNLGEARS